MINRKRKGFTLIETGLAVLIFLLGVTTVFSLVEFGYFGKDYTFQQALSIEEAQRGIETMAKEIREARAGEDGSFPIVRAEGFEFSFFSDVDNDGETEKIRYFLEGTNFKKGIIEPQCCPVSYPSSSERVITLTQYVRNAPPIFRYFDKDGNELGPPANLKNTKRMRVYLVVNVNPARPPQNFVLETDVLLRNLKED